MSSYPVVKVPFLGCALTAYADVTPVLDVTCFAEFLRGEDDTCAFCHGDPVAEKPCADCGGGYVHVTRPGGAPEMHLPAKTFGKRIIQHVPHAGLCTRVTWIDREFWAARNFETCPCCQGRPT